MIAAAIVGAMAIIGGVIVLITTYALGHYMGRRTA